MIESTELMTALAKVGGYFAVALGAVGSAIGVGIAGSASIGAWKKCYLQDKPASFLLVSFAGAPLTQTIYGLIMLIFINGKATEAAPNWPAYIMIGILCGIALLVSAIFQGKAAAAGANALAETGKGFSNYIIVVGVVETCAIFALIFSLFAL